MSEQKTAMVIIIKLKLQFIFKSLIHIIIHQHHCMYDRYDDDDDEDDVVRESKEIDINN